MNFRIQRLKDKDRDIFRSVIFVWGKWVRHTPTTFEKIGDEIIKIDHIDIEEDWESIK